MSEIFLKLRIKEMLEGKMKRYIIFGIVEVFLVVTGILIALSINNWDNKKSQRSDELAIYKNINNRIMDDREDVQDVIDYNDSRRTKFQFANQIISTNNRSKIDTLTKIIPTLTEYSDFNKSSNIYQNLLNSGELKLLKNMNVLTMLQNLEETYIYLNRMENIHQQVVMEIIAPVLLNTINFSSGEAEKPDDLYSLQFQNFFIASIGIMNEKDDIYQRALREIDAVAHFIEEELKE